MTAIITLGILFVSLRRTQAIAERTLRETSSLAADKGRLEKEDCGSKNRGQIFECKGLTPFLASIEVFYHI